MIKRRKFINLTALLSTTALLPNITFPEKKDLDKNSRLLPKHLEKGNTIGLIAPGYAVSPETLKRIKKEVKEMGFIPFHTDRIHGNHGYFSNTDKERAADLNEMFANSKVDAILCARGGYGCTRIMQMIDYENIKLNPKILVGFSDITALLNGIQKETGLITFHGPVGSTIEDDYSQQEFTNTLMQPNYPQPITNVLLKDQEMINNPEYERYTITSGISTGKLVGGSLTLVNALVGTPHEIDFTDAIVCLEDVEEAPYRIDRMLTQLIEGASFKNAKGIVFGVFAGCNSSSNSKSFTLKEVIMDRIAPLQIPAAYGMSFGHVPNNFTFPIGINANWDADKMTLEILEKAVY
ncbi:Muramoyltetrapeptide carboxypeptidase [Flagellimonas maritima]|uniref:Muramoyltetrapeptide carboxypeptidase n=1 Tax=Flagellimonas maritima TaxID=1383885 RepID=A0A2Z4LVQ2_9FLAO|nr:LD-carboxypeptidase [Allomuricauda aurantiaca]AWX45594.1 Muramoyltetrapeptide carboxypeptidase [Allomuricauda aurantiaca]